MDAIVIPIRRKEILELQEIIDSIIYLMYMPKLDYLNWTNDPVIPPDMIEDFVLIGEL